MNQTTAAVKEITCIADGVYSMWFETEIAKEAHPGQFVMVNPQSEAHLLGRPISICETKDNATRFVYRVAGKGTKEFSSLKEGDTVRVLANLGNGFPIEEAEGKCVVLMGGGIKIYSSDFHSLDYMHRRSIDIDKQNKKSSPIHIGNDVFIGAGSTILKGVTIGDRSIIGAGSVVTKSIPSDEIWAGNPAKFIRKV